MRRDIGLRLCLLTFTVGHGSALAQSSDAATAELLFQQGRDLLRAGKAAEACPKLAESQRLDPATGTLLALAMCHEAEGKLASAWAEFVAVEARSRSEGRADRENVARERALALRPRLATLEIRVPSSTAALEGLEIRRDGVVLGAGAWNTAVPVDGGHHSVEVRATGKRSWKTTVAVRQEADAQVLEIPELEPAATAANQRAGATTLGPTADARAGDEAWGTLEWAGVATAGAGVVALGVGGYFLGAALGKKSDSEADCDGNVCGEQGFDDRESAVSHGNTATWLGIAGGVLAGAGATLFIVGQNQSSRQTGAAPVTRVSLGAGPHAVRAQVSTSF